MKNKKEKLIKEEREFLPRGKNAKPLSLNDCLDLELLISPDSKNTLRLIKNVRPKVLSDGKNNYKQSLGSPILYPNEISSHLKEGRLPLKYNYSALLQYTLLSQIKQAGEINAPLSSSPARKHQWRYKDFCKDLRGLVLDVGCDQPSHSIQLIPNNCQYIGLDPYATKGEFRIIGLGEILPIVDASVDVVTFNTSLDHILDYHTAIEEAFRVLKEGGQIVIASYCWLEKATLLTDNVHFHHFREYEIIGALENYFSITDIKKYEDPKHDAHRYGLYIKAKK